MQIVGIDIGTTSVCGVAVDVHTGQILRSKTVDSNAFLTAAHPWEKIQSPKKLVAVARQILDELLCAPTAAIGVTGQMHGIVYTDADGQAVSPLYTWQDERGNQPYKGTTYAGYLNSFAGYGNVTDFYNRQNGLRPTEAVNYCTVHDYFVMQICGLKQPVMHASDAASLGLYDLKSQKFSYDVALNVTSDYCVAGNYNGIPVGVAIGDNQASVFSTLADPRDVLLNVGTGSQISAVTDTPTAGADYECRPYFEGKYLAVGAALCGGRAYAMLKNFYKELLGCVVDATDAEVYGIMDRLLQNTATTTLRADTRFAGTRKDASITGSFTGITQQNFTPGHLALAVVEGMVEELYGMYRQMQIATTGLVGSGNGVRKNPHLIKAAEQKFGAKMKIPRHTEEAAFGAALFAAISAGIFKDARSAQQLIAY